MRVLILGGTRFIGLALVSRLRALGHEVHVMTRPGRAEIAQKIGAVVHPGDRSDETLLASLPACDAVIDFLAMNRADAELAVRAFARKTPRYAAISTGAIYWVQDAARVPWIESDDSFPLRDRNACDEGEFDYGVAKREMEAAFRAAAARDGFPITLVRAPVVSGPGDWRLRDYYWVRRILEGRPCVMPDGGTNVFNHVFVEDLVELLVRVASDRVLAPGEALNAADRVFTSLREYLSWFGSVIGTQPILVDVPRSAIARASIHDRSFFFADTKPHVLDNRKTERATGVEFRTPDRWIPPTVEWCRSLAARPLDAEERERLDAESRLVA